MKTESGEYIVGAYLKLVDGCDVIDYNVRPRERGLRGLAELDVIGIRFNDSCVYLAEVTTHLDGLLYGGTSTTIEKLRDKFLRQKSYADANLSVFKNKVYQFWSPIVRPIVMRQLSGLAQEHGVELIVNQDYTRRMDALLDLAGDGTKDYGNPVFRTLQILQHLKRA